MGRDTGVELSRMAIELFFLREAASAVGEEFLAFLIGMAAREAERAGGEPELHRPRPPLVYAAGEADGR